MTENDKYAKKSFLVLKLILSYCLMNMHKSADETVTT